MNKLKRYVEWMSRGRLTGRVAFTIDPWKVPEPMPGPNGTGSQVQRRRPLLERPELKAVIKTALDDGVALTEDPPAGRGPA